MTRHLVAAALIGIVVGTIGYRFGVLPFTWHGSASFLFPGIAVGAGIAARQLLADGGRVPWPASVGVALLAAAAAVGVAFLVVPPLGHARLATRALPGFSIDLPAGEVADQQIDYATGKLALKHLAGGDDVLVVGWQPGTKLAGDELASLTKLMSGLFGAGNVTTGKPDEISGFPSVAFDTDKGPWRLTAMPCGGRNVIFVSDVAGAMDTLHRRIVGTFMCTPDPSREAALGALPIHLDLPGFKLVPGDPSSIQLTDGASIVMVSSSGGVPTGSLKPLLEKLFATISLTVGDPVGGRYALSGKIEGQAVVGWARSLPCGVGTLVIDLSPDQATADHIAELTGSARCLQPGEKPQDFH